MDTANSNEIRANLEKKSTDELLAIWHENNRQEWNDPVFDIIHQILSERGSEPSEQRNAPTQGEDEETEFKKLLFESTPRFVITPTLIFLNLTIFIIMVLTGVSLFSPGVENLLLWGANFRPFTLNNEWWRLLTSTFIHIGLFHIAFNMWCLWSLGKMAERMFGTWTFLILYIFSGLSASMVSLWWHPDVVSAGASGAIFGVAGGLIMFWYRGKLRVPRALVKENLRSLLLFVGYNLFYGFTESGIDNAAHLGGLSVGLIMGIFFHRPLPPLENYSSRRYNLVFGGLVLSLILSALAAKEQLSDSTVKFVAASDLLEAGKFDAAIEEFEKSIALNPNAAESHNNLGVAYSNKKRYDEAIREFNRTIELNPGKNILVVAYENLGNTYLQQDLYDEAISSLKKALEIQPHLADCQFYIGLAYMGKESYDEASGHFNKALEIDPQMGLAYSNLGKIYLERQLNHKAIAALEKAIELNPRSPQDHLNLGASYMNEELYDQAIKEFNKTIELDSMLTSAYSKLFVAYMGKQDYYNATVSVKIALELNPDLVENHILLGLVYWDQQFYDMAITQFNQTVELAPDFLMAHYQLGHLYRNNGHFAKAISAYREVVRIEPAHVDAHFYIGLSFYKLGQYSNGITAYKRAIRIKPDYAEAHYDLGLVYYDRAISDLGEANVDVESYLNGLQKAAEAFKKAISLKSDAYNSYYMLGLTYAQNELWDEAISAYTMAIRLKPDHLNAHFHLAWAYDENEQYSDAIASYKEAGVSIRIMPKHIIILD